MKRFVFRLDRVLGIRRFELERARLALAQAEAEASRLARRLEAASLRLEQGQRMLEQQAAEGADGGLLALWAQAVRAGRAQWLAARIAVEGFEPTRARAREQVRRCRARVESLERLREQRAARHRRTMLAAEQNELEALAIARLARSGLSLALLLAWLIAPVAGRAQAAADAAGTPGAAVSVATAGATAAGEGASSARGVRAGGGAGGAGRAASDPRAMPDATAALLAGPGFSKGVDLILAEVRARETDLARRELELAERESAVAELEGMVAQRAGELEKIRAEVETRILAWSSQGGDRIDQLSGVYSVMPPGEAAELLSKLELDLAVSVIQRMKKKVSAAVLAAMKPDRALLVSRRILQPLDPATDAPAARPY